MGNNKERIRKIEEVIKQCQLYKREIRDNTNRIFKEYLENKIDYAEYKRQLGEYLQGKTEDEWVTYYDTIILKAKKELMTLKEKYTNEITRENQKIREAAETVEQTKITEHRRSNIVSSESEGKRRIVLPKQTILTAVILLISLSMLFLFKPQITGFFVYNQSNVSNIATTTNITTNVSNITLSTNITSNITENMTANVAENVTTNISAKVTENITNVTKNITTNITTNVTSNIISNITNMTENLTQNITPNITENITANISMNLTNITGNITENVTNITENITNVTQNITGNISGNITNIISNLTENITANITNVTFNVTNITNITVNITANLTENITANVTNVTENTPPELIKEIENFTIKNNETIIINLSNYFIDRDNDTLTFLAIKSENMSVFIEGDIANVTFDNIIGKRTLQFIASDMKNITYSNIVGITLLPRRKNNLPECNFTTLTLVVGEKESIDLNDYCIDIDNDTLTYTTYADSNAIVLLQNKSLLTITPLKEGFYNIAVDANDTKNTTESILHLNITSLQLNEQIIQLPAEIGKPVKWIKKIKLKTGVKTSVRTHLPKEAFNIKVEKEEWYENHYLTKNVDNNKILISNEGITTTLLNTKLKNGEITPGNNTLLNTTSSITGLAVYNSRSILSVGIFLGVKNIFMHILNFVTKMFSAVFKVSGLARITGFAIQQNTNITLIIPSELVNVTDNNFTITYETPAPEIMNETLNITNIKWKKRMTITSEIHYVNITAHTNITEAKQDRIHLYEFINNTRIEVTDNPVYNVSFEDRNNNSLIDFVTWRVPHLSNETYEVDVDLIVLNVQSYPTVGGNWTVRFNTTGTANLKITAVNGTTYTELPIDDNTTSDDLRFLQLKCNNTIMDNTLYIITNDTLANCSNSTDTLIYNLTSTNISCEYYNNSLLVNYTQLLNSNLSLQIESTFYYNYTCDNMTSYYTVSPITPGVHNQEFNFGGVVRYAHNLAGAPVITLNSPVNNTIVHTGVILNFTITDDNLNQTWWSKDNGQTNTTFYSPWNVDTASWSEGDYTVNVWASDNDTNVREEDYYFTFNNSAYGNVTISLIWAPSYANTSVHRYDTFNFSVNISCSGGPCGDLNATLDPIKLRRLIEKKLIEEQERNR